MNTIKDSWIITSVYRATNANYQNANMVFCIKNIEFRCVMYYLTRLVKPVTESRVLEGDSASAGLFTSIPQH